MLTVKQCKHGADLCSKLAAEARDRVEKQILLGMENQWRRLANHLSKRDSRQKRAQASSTALDTSSID